ncbi:hypothetical protein ACIQVL_51360, partial [Streptomyces sp. NPDC090499]|uniref:hypothetical protein n=1 Tax=Streptomyces sp. NPDC090499 TaxID=3365965 RepID=UPI003830A47E
TQPSAPKAPPRYPTPPTRPPVDRLHHEKGHDLAEFIDREEVDGGSGRGQQIFVLSRPRLPQRRTLPYIVMTRACLQAHPVVPGNSHLQ